MLGTILKAKRLIPFAWGVLCGTAGVSILSSTDAKKVYTHLTAAGLRAKDSVLETAEKVRENCEDILAEAKELNESREVDSIIVEDEA